MRRQDINEEKFKELYYNKSISSLAEIFGISTATVSNYARRLGLYKGSGARAMNVIKIIED